jgi:hypothetical protein
MSRHYFHDQYQGQRVCVVLGYDRPLREFFLQVRADPAEDGGDSMLYASLADPDFEGFDLEYIRAQLAEWNIEIPSTLVADLERDAAGLAIDPVVEHLADGTRRVIVARARLTARREP